MGKRKCIFTDKLKEEYKYLKSQSEKGSRVRCSICNGDFSVEHKGRGDIEDHNRSEKHKRALNAAHSSTITSFFKSRDINQSDLLCAAKEATFAFHSAVHEFSFKSADCTSKLIKHLYDQKFSSGKTKTEAIVTNIISPLIFNEVLTELDKVNFVTISIDSSNRKDMKLVPIIIRYFTQNSGIQIKILNFEEVQGETSDILLDYILRTARKHNLEKKIICFCADNTNSNFGGVKRKGENNIYRKLEKRLDRSILGIGCAAHIINNSVQTAADRLPIDIEVIIVKIYKYFYIYTVRNTKLKSFCDEAEVEYKKLLSHSRTRFLSMLPAIQRILDIFDALKLFFMNEEKCPTIIKTFFENPLNEEYLLFLHGTIPLFHNTIKCLESDAITAIEATTKYYELMSKLEERRAVNFIPFMAKQLLLKLKNDKIISDTDETELLTNFDTFYKTNLEYLELWKSNFENLQLFSWIYLKSKLEWPEVEKSAERLISITGKQPLSFFNMDSLFDELSRTILLYPTNGCVYLK